LLVFTGSTSLSLSLASTCSRRVLRPPLAAVTPAKKIKLNNDEVKALNDEMNKLFKSFINSTTQSIIKNN